MPTKIYLFSGSPYERILEVERDEDVPVVTQNLKELIVKLWLISEGRFEDAVTYTPEIEQAATQAMGLRLVPREDES